MHIDSFHADEIEVPLCYVLLHTITHLLLTPPAMPTQWREVCLANKAEAAALSFIELAHLLNGINGIKYQEWGVLQ
uniref:Uncharacterized protein n=1 Tax=Romanomermis culicivorax TaxID=13658 RepID=A0A915K578_ROMCU